MGYWVELSLSWRLSCHLFQSIIDTDYLLLWFESILFGFLLRQLFTIVFGDFKDEANAEILWIWEIISHLIRSELARAEIESVILWSLYSIEVLPVWDRICDLFESVQWFEFGEAPNLIQIAYLTAIFLKLQQHLAVLIYHTLHDKRDWVELNFATTRIYFFNLRSEILDLLV